MTEKESAVRFGDTARPNGRSYANVRCPCGHMNQFALWPWAGHGYLRCKGPGCKRKIDYRTLEVRNG